MALRDILNTAMKEAHIPISDTDFIYHYNRGLNKLAINCQTARLKGETDITCSDTNAWYPFNAAGESIIGIRRVTDDEGFYFSRYHLRDQSSIKFDCDGTFTIEYESPFPAATSMASTADLPALYHDVIAKYVAYKCLMATDATGAARLASEFAEEANSVNTSFRKVRTKHVTAAMPYWG